MTTGSVGSGVGYVQLVRGNRDFRLLWFGQIVSLLGDWFSFIASAILVARLTGSGLAVGGLIAVRMLPPFLVSPIAGVVADRHDRKLLLVATDLSRALIVLGFLVVREPGQVWLLYSLTAVQLGISGFFFPARNAILPDMVSGRELGAANALSSVTWSAMLALGAACGGLVAGRWGVYPAFVIDALTYLLSAALLAGIRCPRRVTAPDERRSALAEFSAGLVYLWLRPATFVIALHKAAFCLTMSGALQVVQVVVARDHFVLGQDGSTGLGLMYAAAGAGTAVGPIVLRRLTGDHPERLRRAIAGAYLLTAVGVLVMAPLASLPVFLLGTFMRGLGGGTNWVFTTQLLMQELPSEVRGRVFGLELGLLTLAQAISTAVGGLVVDTSGLGLTAILCGIAALLLVPGGAWTWWLVHTSRKQAADHDGAA